MCVLKIESNQKVFTWHISFHWSADEDLTTLFEMRMRLLSECATVLSSYSDYFWHLKSVCVCVWLWSSEDPDMDWHVRHGALGKDKLLDWLWVKRGGGEWWWGDGVWLVRAQPTSKEQSLHTHTQMLSHTHLTECDRSASEQCPCHKTEFSSICLLATLAAWLQE